MCYYEWIINIRYDDDNNRYNDEYNEWIIKFSGWIDRFICGNEFIKSEVCFFI